MFAARRGTLVVALDFYEITGGDYEKGTPAPVPSTPLAIGARAWCPASIPK